MSLCVCVCVCVCRCVSVSIIFQASLPSPPLPSLPHRKLAGGKMSVPSREHKYTNMKGLKFNLTTYNKYARNLVCSQARKTVRNVDCVAMATFLYRCITILSYTIILYWTVSSY